MAVKTITVDCTGTTPDQTLDRDAVLFFDRCHRIITPGGMMLRGVDVEEADEDIRVVYVGGKDKSGKAKDTRTPEQKRALGFVARELHETFPDATFQGSAFDVAGEAAGWLAGEGEATADPKTVEHWRSEPEAVTQPEPAEPAESTGPAEEPVVENAPTDEPAPVIETEPTEAPVEEPKEGPTDAVVEN